MKIYQIHECGGEWEDYYDYIVGSYLSRGKAVAVKEQLEVSEVEATKCNKCPLLYCPDECNLKCGTKECEKHAINEAKKYCNSYKFSRHNKCENYHYKSNESYFRIEEVEVVE